jgi:anti-sigma factor RsiW
MTEHIESGELQDFGEGLLPPAEEARVRSHIEDCPQCREELEALSLVREGLGGLPLEANPSRDLWPQIAWRMEGVPVVGAGGTREGRPSEEALPEGTARNRKKARLFSVPAWQLLAASITVALISGGSVWAILSNRTAQPTGVPFSSPSAAQMAGMGEAYGGYEEAITDFEAVLERGRGVLDPQTIAVLEENLGTIDRAIQEAGEALANDPASTILRRILGDNLRLKVEVLRKAAVAVYSTT